MPATTCRGVSAAGLIVPPFVLEPLRVGRILIPAVWTGRPGTLVHLIQNPPPEIVITGRLAVAVLPRPMVFPLNLTPFDRADRWLARRVGRSVRDLGTAWQVGELGRRRVGQLALNDLMLLGFAAACHSRADVILADLLNASPMTLGVLCEYLRASPRDKTVVLLCRASNPPPSLTCDVDTCAGFDDITCGVAK